MSRWQKKNVLITGGAGFIGTALADKLRNEGHNVELLDLGWRFTEYHRSNYNSLPIDVRKWQEFDSIAERKYDLLFHLAAQTSGAISQEQPQVDVDTNVKGTLNICEYAKKTDIKKVIFTSSMAVYGNAIDPVKEDDRLKPLSIYGASKAGAEFHVRSLRQFGIGHAIFRLFNVYGPGQDMNNMRQGMLSIYVAQAVKGNVINVTGSDERYRDFVYIDDVVEALILGISDIEDDTINVGRGERITVRKLIEMIGKEKHGSEGALEIINIGSHDGDQRGVVADIAKIESYGWKPTVDLETGLRETFIFARKVML